MEAISCGIPVIATDVGANAEIVSEVNGLLLTSNPSLDEIANALFFFPDNPVNAENMRRGSRAVWQQRFDANENYAHFISEVKRLFARDH
jgi:colanic acid/amylovoran biosynthesis glycosyltransferase